MLPRAASLPLRSALLPVVCNAVSMMCFQELDTTLCCCHTHVTIERHNSASQMPCDAFPQEDAGGIAAKGSLPGLAPEVADTNGTSELAQHMTSAASLKEGSGRQNGAAGAVQHALIEGGQQGERTGENVGDDVQQAAVQPVPPEQMDQRLEVWRQRQLRPS